MARDWPEYAYDDETVCPVTGESHEIDPHDLHVQYGGEHSWQVRCHCRECGADATIPIDDNAVDDWGWVLSKPSRDIDLDDLP